MGDCIPFVHTVELNNRTILRDNGHHKEEAVSFEMILLCIFALFVITTNLSLVVGLKKTNKKLTISQKLYSYLSCTDSIMGIVCLPYFAIVNFLSINDCKTQAIGMAISIYSFSIGLGTFFAISVLRNMAIRKPFHKVKNGAIRVFLVLINLLSMISSCLTFYTYYPKYTSKTLYCFYWMYAGMFLTFAVLLTVALNVWSKRALKRQSADKVDQNDIILKQRKRNLKAVGILNKISLVYTICTLQVGLYYGLLSVLLLTNKENEKTFEKCYNIFALMHLPIFLCSGFNALIYMVKDDDIKRFYSCKRFCLNRN